MNIVAIEDALATLPPTIQQQHLTTAWRSIATSLSLDPGSGMEMIIAVPRDVSLLQAQRFDSAWGGAWEWNLSEGVTKSAVVSALVAAALVAVGAGTGIAPVLIPTVIPFLFDVKRIRLERTADNYLRILGARDDIKERQGSADSLYDLLPDDARSLISRIEFSNFLRQAVEAGRANEEGGHFEVLPNGENSFRIAIR